MKIGAIIFSRFSSSRLPGKAFMDISGKTLIERVIDRAMKLKSVDHIALATSTNLEDDKIASYAKLRGIDVYRGSLDDVAGRAMGACLKFKYDHFLRICADRPFFDPNLYDYMISYHRKHKHDLTTNIFPRIVPPGFTCEVIDVKAFKKMLELTNDRKDREHVTRFIYRNSNDFSIANVDYKKSYNYPNLRLVIDDKLDLERARWISSRSNENNNSNQIISLALQWEKIKKYSI